MALPKARRVWLWLHRWTGLTLGLLLALAALLGAALTVLRPLDQALHPELFRSAAQGDAGPAALELLRQRLVAEFGPKATMTLRPPRESGESLRVLLKSPQWEGTLYIDPSTGREQGRRGEHEGVANFIFELHSALLLGDTGKAILASVSLAYLALLLTGLILWWPMNAAQWRHAFALKLGKGATRALFDLHRLGGVVLGLLIVVSVASGAWMAWRPLGVWVSSLAGEAPVKPPKVGRAEGPPLSLDEIVAAARARWPEGMVGYVQLGAAADRPVRVRLKLPDDPHPNGLSSVWLHPVDGALLAQQRWNSLDLGGRSTAWIYPLHTGTLGGPLHEAATGLIGLSLFGLGFSGAWLWWRRRR
ncbi:PepSY-associated TM helix domain-containing protein [Paucibacter sp. XJ19-41]|uniref:PepSY-associated TM helix domain-containing protein n=1 Tax=Paucibacter sp. XJ19-41 TaxID=2927824 RepID=UPI00234B2C38|nr:PepSY domain-containing protein [Paucibacter sp. XJ19-41]MDC6166220.1 PepSY domain-containing protein [Paucibacter sp. XJ19-41]